MLEKKLICVVLFFIVLNLTLVSADIGFGMTEVTSNIIMSPSEDEVCVTYYLWNPGDVDIEGYLDVDRESGGTLNRLLLLDTLYSQLDELEEEQVVLQQEYQSVVASGQSTFEVEKKITLVNERMSLINSEIVSKKPHLKIQIPAHTTAKNENGQYQIPIDICFKRPQEKYLYFFSVGNTDYCGVYEGNVVGRYTPLSSGSASTGSAIIGSRSSKLKVTVQCNVYEKRGALIKAGLAALFIITLVAGVSYLLWKKNRQRKKANKETGEDNQLLM